MARCASISSAPLTAMVTTAKISHPACAPSAGQPFFRPSGQPISNSPATTRYSHAMVFRPRSRRGIVDCGVPACSHRGLHASCKIARAPEGMAKKGYAMNERELRGLIDSVKTGRLSRRGFVQRMLAVGLTAPMATQLLAISGVAMAQSPSTYKPTKRGGGGALKTLWWQGATLLNPHFAVGTKDQDGSRIFYEPLACWDPDGALYPVLAAEIPDLENGGLAKDGKSATWKLKQGVKWHDGKPFTADDVVFNWQYASDPATATTTVGSYNTIKAEKVDTHTVRILFDKPT